jgi:hypothetical protein
MSWLKKIFSFGKGNDILPKKKDIATDTEEAGEPEENNQSDDADETQRQMQLHKERFNEDALNDQIMDDFMTKNPNITVTIKREETSDGKTTLKINDVKNFFVAQAVTKLEPLKKELEGELKRYEERKERTKITVENLKTAQLLNKDIPTRVIQIMEGNREAYIRAHVQFLEQNSPPQTITYRNCVTFCDYYSQNVARFAKSTAKSHMVLNEFFSRELAQISKDMKSLTEATLEMKALLDDWSDEFKTIENTKGLITEIIGKNSLINEIAQEIENTKKKIETNDQLRAKLERELNELKGGQDFSQFSNIDTEKKRIWREMKNVEDDISHIFGILDRPMRKLQRIIVDNKKTLDMYVADPTTALLDDKDLEIMKVLDKLRVNVEDGTLGFQDKEKDKIIAKCAEINKLDLAAKQTRYRELRGAMKILDEQMRQTKVLQDIDDTQYKINHTQEQTARLQERLASLNEQASKLALDELKKGVSEHLSKISGEEVQVI